MDRHLSALISPNQDINDDRAGGIEMIQGLHKTPYVAIKDDVRWFEADMDIDTDHETTVIAKEYVEKHFELLNNKYPFELTEWLMNWYRFMPEALYYRWDNTGQLDWNIFFTLIYPLPGLPCPFCLLIDKLNVKQNQMVREQIYMECYKNKILRNNLINLEVIPTMYTHYASYWKIRKEVLWKIQVSNYPYFQRVDKMKNAMKCTTEEAVRLIDNHEVA